jgi:CheY-like chemotaxis protein
VCRRVLVVDDNADFRETLSRLLDRWGHKTVLLPSGAGALEKALQFHPDIALIDLGLPQMDGFAVAECLRRAPELARMRLIAMSGYGEELERAHAAQSGFHDFLLKPVDPGFLRELLKTPAGDG